MPSTLHALWALILTALRGGDTVGPRPSDRFRLPDGTFPVMAGADPEDDPDPDDDPDPEPDPEPVDDDDPPKPKVTPKADDDPAKWDPERAKRTIEKQRRAERDAVKRAEAAERERDELRKAQESEAERVIRERDEAKAEAQRARDHAHRLAVDAAVRDAAADADVEPKKVRRLLKLVDRDGLTVDADGQVDTDAVAEAVADVLDDFPEFKAAAPKVAADEGEDPEPARREPPGGGPDRKRKPKPMTAEQARKLARDNPDEWNRKFEAGEIPAAALAGR